MNMFRLLLHVKWVDKIMMSFYAIFTRMIQILEITNLWTQLKYLNTRYICNGIPEGFRSSTGRIGA